MYTTKAEQKRDLDSLNREYSKQRKIIADIMREIPHSKRGEDWNEDYWNLPFDLHQWRKKHEAIGNKYSPEATEAINNLFQAREAVKATEVMPRAKKKTPEVTIISDFLAEAKKDFAEFENLKERILKAGITLDKEKGIIKIKGMTISVVPVFVYGNIVSDHVRHTYYVDGKLTKGSVVQAAIEVALSESE